MAEPYNDACRGYFFAPAHAGPLSRDYPLALTASARESAQGAVIELAAGIIDDIIVEMRFRARGCPHLLAAAEAICRDREQAAVAGLSVFDASELIQKLAIPVEKTGRILLLEDALKSLWAEY
jgi:nitrogen fixation NifU-like protein